MKWLLCLYPPAWRRRYGAEMRDLLQETDAGFVRTTLDLLAGAIDAWLNPGWTPEIATPEVATPEGGRTMLTACRRRNADISIRDALISSSLMIGVTLVLTILAVTLDKTVGPHIAIEALLYSAFFIALTLSSRRTYLKPYSAIASNGLMLLICVGWYAFFFGVVAFRTLI